MVSPVVGQRRGRGRRNHLFDMMQEAVLPVAIACENLVQFADRMEHFLRQNKRLLLLVDPI